MPRKSPQILPNAVDKWYPRVLGPIPGHRTFHLMENWIMTSVYRVPAIHISADEKAIAFISSEDVRLMGRSVRPQNGILVKVVSVGSTPSRMVGWKPERVKILLGRHHGKQ
jgi:hypothetical protein